MQNSNTMKNPSLLLSLTLTAACLLPTTLTLAQQPPRGEGPPPRFEGERGEREGRGERGGRDFFRLSPINAALDANQDGTIDEVEITNASKALKTLDKNGDGKLTPDELRPEMPPRGREGAAPGSNPEVLVNRLMQADANGDGKLSQAELPERMQALMQRLDKDNDGFLTREELAALAAANNAPAGAPQRGERPGEGRRPR
ncbi:MAG: hypothetical protein RI897_4523 [Verrucomicrobiota bacterium]|jgi:hypothetical protein